MVTASPTIMGILHPDQVKILLPIRTLFLERRRAIANLHPARGLIGKKPRIIHVAKVLSLRYRAFTQCATVDSFQKRTFAARFHACLDVISHSFLMTEHTRPMRSLTSRIAPAKPLACASGRP